VRQKGAVYILAFRHSFISAIKLTYIGMFLCNAFFPSPYLQAAMCLVAVSLFLLIFSEARPATRLMSVLLIGVGVYFLLSYQATPQSWIKASTYNAPLISLVLTVPLLGSILYFEPYQHHLSILISKFASSPYRFYAVASMLLTLLAALINLASFHFIHQLLRNTAEKYPAKLFNSALVRGFIPNVMWSPSYISVALAAQYSNISWFTLAPVGIAMAVAGVASLLAFGWFEYGHMENTVPQTSAPPSQASLDQAYKSLVKLLLQTAILISLIVALEYITHKSAMIIVPLVSFTGPLLLALIFGKTEAYLTQSREFITQRLPLMNNEFVLFTAIGFFGYALGISDIPAYIPILINQLGLDTALTLLPVIVFAIGLLSLIGIHPMITIAALAASLPPGSTPLSNIQMAGSYLAGYTLYSVISPFSAANLLAGSLSKESPLDVGLMQNGMFAMVYTIVSIGIILIFF
jgi:hypothetical protein